MRSRDGLREIGRPGDPRLEDGLAIHRPQPLIVHLMERLPGLIHRDEEAEDPQARVGPGLDQADRLLDIDDPSAP